MTDLVLVGGGGHCRSCIDVIETAATFRIAGIVQRASDGTDPVFGYPVIGSDDDLFAIVTRFKNAIVTVGQIKSSKPRARLYEALRSLGATLPVIASPKAHVSKRAHIDSGTMVMHGAVVNAGARVGENGIINSLALIEHDAVVEAHCHVSTGARVNGGACVGTGTFIGSGAVIRQGVSVGAQCIVAAGSVVLHDVPPGTLVRAGQ
jgi:sugar O-acyltransferase (sialic acid O-acetyltransferase NeuD family)